MLSLIALYDFCQGYVAQSRFALSRLNLPDFSKNALISGLPPPKWSSAMFRKTEEDHGEQDVHFIDHRGGQLVVSRPILNSRLYQQSAIRFICAAG